MLKASTDGLSKVWKPQKVWGPFYKGGKMVFSPDGQTIYCEYEGNVKIVSVNDPSIASDLFEAEAYEAVSCFCLHPDGQQLVVATAMFSLRHWDLRSKTTSRNIKAHKMPILCMEYDSSGTLVATGSADRAVRVFDVLKAHCTHSFTGHTDLVRTVLFQGLFLFTSSDDCSVRAWDLSSSTPAAVLKDHVALCTQIAFSPDGRYMASVGRDKVLNVYTHSTPCTLRLLTTLPLLEELEAVLFSPSTPEVVLTAGSSGQLRAHRIDAQGVITPLSQQTVCREGISGLHLLGGEVVVAVSRDHLLTLHPLGGDGVPGPCGRTLVGCYGDILDLCCVPVPGAPEGVLAVVTNSCSVKLLHPRGGVEVLDGHSDIVLAVDASPCGTYLATSSKDHTVRLYALNPSVSPSASPSASYTLMGICCGHTEAVGAIALAQYPPTYASRSAFLVSGAGDKVLKLFPVRSPVRSADGKPSGLADGLRISASVSVRAHEKDINTVAVAPNDSLIASGSQDKCIRLWDRLLAPLAVLKGHKRGVWKVLFHPTDRTLLSTSSDRSLRIWSLVDHSALRVLEGHSASVLDGLVVAAGQQVLSAGADGMLRLHTLRSGELEASMDQHSDRIWALAHTPQGMVVSGGSDGRIVQWADCTAEEVALSLQAAEAKLLVEQAVANHLRGGRHLQALKAALTLTNSAKVLEVLQAILDTSSEALQQHILQLSEDGGEEVLQKLLRCVVEWNTNARHAHLTQHLLAVLLKHRPAVLRACGDALPTLLAYSERHFQRLSRLAEASYYLEYVAGMAALPPLTQRVLVQEQDDEEEVGEGGGTDKESEEEELAAADGGKEGEGSRGRKRRKV